MKPIFHITSQQAWQETIQAHKPYHAPSLDTEGFIHCSTAHQVIETANYLFKGQQGLLLLLIDETQVTAPVIYEDLYQMGQDFPHIYGTLPLEAVITTLPFSPTPSGLFTMPAFPPHLNLNL